MDKDFDSLSPSELNSRLKEACGVGLYPFAEILHEVIREPIFRGRTLGQSASGWGLLGWNRDQRRFLTEEEVPKWEAVHRPPWAAEELALSRACFTTLESSKIDGEVARRLRKKIANLRKKILETIREIDEIRSRIHTGGNEEAERDRMLYWGVGEFLCMLQVEFCDLSESLAVVGRPANARTETACLWAKHIHRKGRRVAWPVLAEMMDWFMAKLYPHAFYHEFFVNDELSDPEYLKQQFHKNRKRWESFYSYRRRAAKQRDPFFDALFGFDRSSRILTFGKTQDEFGAIFKDFGGSSGMRKLAVRIFHDTPKLKCGVIFPDLSFFAE